MYTRHTNNTLNKIYSDALAIRKQVFIEEQQVPRKREIDADEPHAIHFVLYTEQKEAVATVRLLAAKQNTIKLQRMAVVKQARKKGYGKIIMKEAESYAKNNGYHKIILGAQITARNFYHNLGYQEEGDFFLDAGIQHITMMKKI
ncbi:GNAT family N-acetyltransferase [Tetragenococcus solitarius]|uniref:GNAT family N-acetyltransferase n=1 Tax=Tetragenococcus solitarius TaxID=71453 RepID=A0ABP6KWA9_9ENTE|nr:GNAT family N-acetyltransferase [Tetragenococcus solitarius]